MNPWTIVGWLFLSFVGLLVISFGILLIGATIVSVKESAKKRLK